MSEGPKNLRTDQQQLASGKPINRSDLRQSVAALPGTTAASGLAARG
jgi:hypothetical protein